MTSPFLKFGSNYTFLAIGIFLLFLNTFFFKNGLVGILSLFVYFVPLSLILGEKICAKQKSQNFLSGLLFILTELIIAGSIVYYAYKITPTISFLLLLLPVFTAFLLPKKENTVEEKQPASQSLFSPVLTFSIVALDIFLLIYLYTHRTYELAASPWLQVGPIFFELYALTTLLLFIHYKKQTNFLSTLVLTSVHFFVGIAVALIIYPQGYGFDAFIHRATQEWIAVHGFIAPKNPYYIGQYSLVTVLSHVSHLKIFFVDILLVPLLSAIFLPGIILMTIKKFFSDSKMASLAFWILPFVPFLSLHLTTPHNLVILFTILIVFLSWSASKKEISFLLPFLVAIAAVVTHPLVGAPVFIFTLSLFLIQKFAPFKKLTMSIVALTFLGLCLLLPVLFTLNGLRIGKSLPTITNPFTHIGSFLDLFQLPYWYAKTSSIQLETLYLCQRLIVPAFLVLALVGFFYLRKKEKSIFVWLFPLTAIALFIDAWLLRSWIVFPDVVTYEQGDYPKRLLSTSLIFLLPLAIYGFLTLYGKALSFFKSQNTKKYSEYLLLVLMAVTLTCTLYLSYPQRNLKVRFPGYNVTQSDFKAVEWIQAQNSDSEYIVLSNQLVSAAALTKYSFAKYFDTPQGELFYYSIPTGGVLYKYYGKMIYEGQKPEYMEEAMKIAGVKKAYFVVNYYWAKSSEIVENAEKSADRMQVIDDKIWVFEYISK